MSAVAVSMLGDQPRLPDGLLRDLLATFSSSGKPIAAPVYRGVQGTPVVFAASVFGNDGQGPRAGDVGGTGNRLEIDAQ